MQRPLDEAEARAAVKAAFDAVAVADVRVNINASETGFLRWAVNGATTSGQVTDAAVSVSCAVGNKHGSADVHGLAPADIAAAARRALEIAQLAPDDPEYLPSLGAAAVKPVPVAWSDTAVSADDRAAIVADAIASAKKQGLVGAGFLESRRASGVVATRAGFFGIHHSSSIALSTTARTPDGSGSGWGTASAVALKDLDAAAAVSTACDKALRSRNAKPLEPGVYPVVLEPAAVGSLMGFMPLDARSADEGHSPFTKPGGGTRVGEKLLGELTLRVDPWHALLPSAPFDFQGMPRPPLTFIGNGVLEKLGYSRYWGKKMKHPADANYDRLLASGPRPQTLAELVAGLERGLVVTHLFYIRMLEPQTVTVTGLTRDGVFLVEKGQIVGPVNNFRFNQSVLQMFADADGYTAPVRVESDEMEARLAPALRCKAFHMASRSDAI
jgi:predicted Zn-dependent protease